MRSTCRIRLCAPLDFGDANTRTHRVKTPDSFDTIGSASLSTIATTVDWARAPNLGPATRVPEINGAALGQARYRGPSGPEFARKFVQMSLAAMVPARH